MPNTNVANTDGVGLVAKAEFFKEAGKLINLDKELGQNYLQLGKLAVDQGFISANSQMMMSFAEGSFQAGGAGIGIKTTMDMANETKNIVQNNARMEGIAAEQTHLTKGQGAIISQEDGTLKNSVKTLDGKTTIRTQAELDSHIGNLDKERLATENRSKEMDKKIDQLGRYSQGITSAGQGVGAIARGAYQNQNVKAQTFEALAKREDQTEKVTESAVTGTLQSITQARLYVAVAV